MKKARWKNKAIEGISYTGSYQWKGKTRLFVLNWRQSSHRRLSGKTQFIFQSHEDAKLQGWKKLK